VEQAKQKQAVVSRRTLLHWCSAQGDCLAASCSVRLSSGLVFSSHRLTPRTLQAAAFLAVPKEVFSKTA
jgi:hypothetical protein